MTKVQCGSFQLTQLPEHWPQRSCWFRCNWDIRHRGHDTQHNDPQHNNTQHKGFICDAQQKGHSA